MPISTSGVITAADDLATIDGKRSGATRASDFAVVGDVNRGTQLNFGLSNVPAGSAVVLQAPAASGTIAAEGVASIQYAAPLTEATVALASTTTNLIINPAGTIAALTVTLPAASDGKKLTFSSSQIITALTLTPAGDDTVANDVTAMTAGQAVTLIARSGVWYRG